MMEGRTELMLCRRKLLNRACLLPGDEGIYGRARRVSDYQIVGMNAVFPRPLGFTAEESREALGSLRS